MRKTLFFWMAAASMTIMMSCGGKGGRQQVAVAEDDANVLTMEGFYHRNTMYLQIATKLLLSDKNRN